MINIFGLKLLNPFDSFDMVELMRRYVSKGIVIPEKALHQVLGAIKKEMKKQARKDKFSATELAKRMDGKPIHFEHYHEFYESLGIDKRALEVLAERAIKREENQ